MSTTRQRRLDAGLCAVCGNRPHRTARKTCEECGRDASTDQKARYHGYRKLGLCGSCGSEPEAKPGGGTYALCSGCKPIRRSDVG